MSYKLLVIPFVSKKRAGEISKIKCKAKYSFEGNAYYIINEEFKVVWQRAELSSFEYRPTDKEMMKPTNHYEKITKKGFDRERIFPLTEHKIVRANKEQIEEVNNFVLKNIETVLGVEGLISGSNSSGADKKMKSSPIVFDPRKETDFIRFTNAIKRIRIKDKAINEYIQNNITSFSDIKKHFPDMISIRELQENNELFGEWFKIINFVVEKNNKNDKTYPFTEIAQSDIEHDVEYEISLYREKLLDKSKLVTKLRSKFRTSLLKYADDEKLVEFTGDENILINDTEACHIVDVKLILKHNFDLRMIADPNNGLLLSPNTHTIFDKNKITFNANGDIVIIDVGYNHLNKKTITPSVLTNKRVQNLRIREELLSNKTTIL
ncbi:MAG: HNH endonuclease [Mycoplasmataceae bacterium]|nr:HNH endonuclease [Mycoplasmataceae bacterium]